MTADYIPPPPHIAEWLRPRPATVVPRGTRITYGQIAFMDGAPSSIVGPTGQVLANVVNYSMTANYDGPSRLNVEFVVVAPEALEMLLRYHGVPPQHPVIPYQEPDRKESRKINL